MKRVTVIVFALVALIACARNEETGTQVSARPVVREARAEKVTLKEVDRLYETAGSVQAETVSILSSKVMGEVTSIRVQVGEEVHKGQLLMTIDDSDISKKVQGAEAAYAEAASGLIMARENLQLTAATHERFKRLFDEKALTRQEMDEMDTKKRIAEAQVRQAEAMVQRSEASLQEARTHLGYARIVSPIDGIVSDKKIDLGTMASPGLPLLVIEDPSLYTININVDEQLFSRMKRGMRVSVSLSALGLET
ncbi:MAG: efflux RND transporter periplasmic adaptor subunit, partial [bacterium]